MAYVLMTVQHGSSQEVAKTLLMHEEINNIHELFGQYDLIAHVVVDDSKQLSDFVHDSVISVPEVESTETLVVSNVIDQD